MLDGKHSSHDIATAICQAYDVEYEQACQDIESLLTSLHDNNLLIDTPASQSAV
jgi:Coenzyme PQQ synthesis protein D (PqqD)